VARERCCACQCRPKALWLRRERDVGERARSRGSLSRALSSLVILAPAAGAPDSAALRLACAILGEGMSARLFARLRDRDHSLMRSARRSACAPLASQLIAYIGTGADTVDQALEGIVRETRALLTDAPTTDEIRARAAVQSWAST